MLWPLKLKFIISTWLMLKKYSKKFISIYIWFCVLGFGESSDGYYSWIFSLSPGQFYWSDFVEIMKIGTSGRCNTSKQYVN